MQAEYVLLVALGVLLILGPLFRGLLERLGVPALIGYIVLGVLVSLLDHQWSFATQSFENAIGFLAELGVFAILFRVGLKSHTSALLEKLPEASFIWIGDVLTNLVFGFVVSRYVLSLPLEASLVIATAFSATSVAVSVAVLDEMKMLNTSRGNLLVDIAELDDLSGVILLALILAIIPVLGQAEDILWSSIGWTIFTVVVKLVLFIVGCYLFSHYVEKNFTRFNKKWEDFRTGMTISLLGTGLVIAAIAGQLGFSLAIGALFAGLAFSRDPEAVRAETRFTYLHDFFAPFFFIHIGMQVDPGAIAPSIGMACVLFVPAVLGKLIGVAVPAVRIVGRRHALTLGVSMIPRAEIAMVIMFQCRQFSNVIISNTLFASMILMAVMTSIAGPIMLRYMLDKR
jgi:Kef-type K+ transport system membrane component KefB